MYIYIYVCMFIYTPTRATYIIYVYIYTYLLIYTQTRGRYREIHDTLTSGTQQGAKRAVFRTERRKRAVSQN